MCSDGLATETGLQPITEVDEGELVYAYNEVTGEVGLYPVTDEIAHLDKEIVTLVIEGERIYTTPEHPFYVNGQWIDASNLSVGDLVRRLDGSAGDVEAVTVEERPQVMYNLTVAVAHTFFVGEQQWLVHNCSSSVVRYGDKASGTNNHHGIMDAWASANVPGYVSRASGAPTVQMSVEAHAKTTTVFREWLTENYGKPVGVKVDWSKHSRQEIYNLSERMFDAAGTPDAVRTRYYGALDSYLKTGKWE
ncbi:MAG: hypothetical protein DYG89_53025 [Caldilinea sp. CFX5]|nr:hypothetical protein [Caldilinea sp. CFX5]